MDALWNEAKQIERRSEPQKGSKTERS
jgi:hypothetical protein